MLLALKEMICSEIMANLTSLILKKTVNIKKSDQSHKRYQEYKIENTASTDHLKTKRRSKCLRGVIVR